MSRLQVGGLALVIKGLRNDKNVGKVVELVDYDGSVFPWKIYSKEGLICDDYIVNCAWITEDRLMPLGDKQTQDELKKEMELVK